MSNLRLIALLGLGALAGSCGSAPPAPAEATPVRPAQAEGVLPDPSAPSLLATPQEVPRPPEGLADADEWRAAYRVAREHERNRRYPEAIASYTELIEARGGYDDAALRKKTLVALVGLAEELYARAIAAPSEEEALALLEEIEVFWPGFRDTASRLAELRDD